MVVLATTTTIASTSSLTTYWLRCPHLTTTTTSTTITTIATTTTSIDSTSPTLTLAPRAMATTTTTALFRDLRRLATYLPTYCHSDPYHSDYYYDDCDDDDDQHVIRLLAIATPVGVVLARRFGIARYIAQHQQIEEAGRVHDFLLWAEHEAESRVEGSRQRVRAERKGAGSRAQIGESRKGQGHAKRMQHWACQWSLNNNRVSLSEHLVGLGRFGRLRARFDPLKPLLPLARDLKRHLQSASIRT